MEISKDTKLCEAYMGKYPVISISLKGINAAAYEDAFDFAVQIMQRTAEEFQFLSDSEYLSEHDKSVYRELFDSKDRKSTRLNSSHSAKSRMPSSA